MKRRFDKIASSVGCIMNQYESWKDSMRGYQVSISIRYSTSIDQFDDCWLGGDEQSQNSVLSRFKELCIDLKEESDGTTTT